jgi:glycosyltransferase involved in cell wall biosynthesis
MKIVEVSPTFPPNIGGVESHVHLLSKVLVDKGFDIEVFTTDPNARGSAKDYVDNIPVTRFPSIAPFDTIYYSRSLTKALESTEADIVHAHGFRALPMLSAAMARKRNEYRFVVTTHLGFSKLGRLPYILYNPVFGRMIFNRAGRILLVSKQEPSALPILRRYSQKVEHIPNGIEVGKESFRETYFKKQEEGLNLLYVGRLEKKKGIDTAIRILGKIPEKGVTLDITGVGGYYDHLRKMVEMTNLESRVRFHGRVDDGVLSELYNRSHVLLLLSEYESFPMVIIEAMNAGVVPIATRVGDVPFEIGEKAGFVVDYPVDEMNVVRIVRELNVDRDKLQETGREGWKRVREMFDMRRIAARIGSIYENL